MKEKNSRRKCTVHSKWLPLFSLFCSSTYFTLHLSLPTVATFFINLLPLAILHLKKKIYWLILRERHQFVVPFIYVFIGWFLYVPWLGNEPSTLAYQDDALTSWTTWPGHHLPSSWHRSWKEAYQDGIKFYSHFHFQKNTSHCHQIPAKLPVKGREDTGSDVHNFPRQCQENERGGRGMVSGEALTLHTTGAMSLCFWEVA